VRLPAPLYSFSAIALALCGRQVALVLSKTTPKKSTEFLIQANLRSDDILARHNTKNELGSLPDPRHPMYIR
jgi:hypothetical protein